MRSGTADREGKSFGFATPRTRSHSTRTSACLLLFYLSLHVGLLVLVAAPTGASNQVKPSQLYKYAAKLTKRGLVYEAVAHLEEAVKLSPKNKKFQKALLEAKTVASAKAFDVGKGLATRDLDNSKHWLVRSLEYNPQNTVAAEELASVTAVMQGIQERLDRAEAALLIGDVLAAKSNLLGAEVYRGRMPRLDSRFLQINKELAVTEKTVQTMEDWEEHHDVQSAIESVSAIQEQDSTNPYITVSLAALGDSIAKYALDSLGAKATTRPIGIVNDLIWIDRLLSLGPTDDGLLKLRAARIDALASSVLSTQSYLPDPHTSTASAKVVLATLRATSKWLGTDPLHVTLSREATPLASLPITITVDMSPSCPSELNTAATESLGNSYIHSPPSIRTESPSLDIFISDLACTKIDVPRSDLQSVNSTYVAGYNQIQNPTYIQVRDQLASAEQALQRATYENETNPNMFSGMTLGLVRLRVTKLGRILASTQPTLKQEIVQQYQHERFEAVRSYAITGRVGLRAPDSEGWLTKDVSAVGESRSLGVAGVLPTDKSGARNETPRVKAIEKLMAEATDAFKASLTADTNEVLAGYFVLVSKDEKLSGIDRLAAAMHLVDVANGTPYEEIGKAIALSTIEAALSGSDAALEQFRSSEPLPLPPVLTMTTRAHPGRSKPISAESVIQDVLKSVVLIETDTSSTGSGFVVSQNCLIVTNHHVVKGAETIVIKTHDRKLLLGQVLADDETKDLALLTTNAKDSCDFLELGSVGAGRVGEDIFVIGNPLGLSGSVTKGIISGRRSDGDSVEYIQVDAAVNPGNSGGPVIDQNGKVLGVTTFRLRETEGLNFAVAASEVSRAFAQFFD